MTFRGEIAQIPININIITIVTNKFDFLIFKFSNEIFVQLKSLIKITCFNIFKYFFKVLSKCN